MPAQRHHQQQPYAPPSWTPRAGLVSHLRRSELAGWRTKSLFPTRNLQDVSTAFLPILKLRGLPYFCSKRHILTWFGDLAENIVELLFIAEVDQLNSGFALVTMDSPESALSVWRKLHKKPITSRRFVEVFTLLPPHCPLCRRGSVPSDARLSPDGPPGLHMPNTCAFCLTPLGSHADGGAASRATLRMRQAVATGRLGSKGAPGLMHTAFLKVPALLYQDSGLVTRNEVDMFEPELWQSTRFYSRCACLSKFPPERLHTLEELEAEAGVSIPKGPPGEALEEDGSSTYFFDLMDVMGYDLRMLLCEIVEIVQRSRRNDAQDESENAADGQCQTTDSMSIAEIGNDLSTRGRAYLFITEVKLKNVLEAFNDLFIVSTDPKSMLTSVNLQEATAAKGVQAVIEMEALQLTRRQKAKRDMPAPQECRRSACRGGAQDDFLYVNSPGELMQGEWGDLTGLHRARTAAVNTRERLTHESSALYCDSRPPPPPLDRHRSALTYLRPRSGSYVQLRPQLKCVDPSVDKPTWSTAMVAEFLQNVSVQLMVGEHAGTLAQDPCRVANLIPSSNWDQGNGQLWDSYSAYPNNWAAEKNMSGLYHAQASYTPLSRSSTCPSPAPGRAGYVRERSGRRAGQKVRATGKRGSVPAEVYYGEDDPPLGTFANDLPEDSAYYERRGPNLTEAGERWEAQRNADVYSDDQRLVDHMTALTAKAPPHESVKHVMENVASLLESIAGRAPETPIPLKPRGRRVSISALQQSGGANRDVN